MHGRWHWPRKGRASTDYDPGIDHHRHDKYVDDGHRRRKASCQSAVHTGSSLMSIFEKDPRKKQDAKPEKLREFTILRKRRDD